MLEVDVLKHHRFCDEFSHLVYKRFVASASLCFIHDPIDVLDLLKVELNGHNHSIDLNQLFHQFNKCLK